jgi:hypothetical protein
MARRVKIDLGHIVEPLWPLAVPISGLKLDPKNSRAHDERSIEAIVRSIARYRQRKAVVVQRDGMVVRAGNGTVEAIRRLGRTHVAAIVLDDDDRTAAGYGVADNRTAELSKWDFANLLEVVDDQRLDPDDFALGFEQAEIDRFIRRSAVGSIEPLDVRNLRPSFWLTVRGPLDQRDRVVAAVRRATAGLEGVEVVASGDGDS